MAELIEQWTGLLTDDRFKGVPERPEEVAIILATLQEDHGTLVRSFLPYQFAHTRIEDLQPLLDIVHTRRQLHAALRQRSKGESRRTHRSVVLENGFNGIGTWLRQRHWIVGPSKIDRLLACCREANFQLCVLGTDFPIMRERFPSDVILAASSQMSTLGKDVLCGTFDVSLSRGTRIPWKAVPPSPAVEEFTTPSESHG